MLSLSDELEDGEKLADGFNFKVFLMLSGPFDRIIETYFRRRRFFFETNVSILDSI
jgi:hypothetical protein